MVMPADAIAAMRDLQVKHYPELLLGKVAGNVMPNAAGSIAFVPVCRGGLVTFQTSELRTWPSWCLAPHTSPGSLGEYTRLVGR